MAVCRFSIFIENMDQGVFFFKVGKVADMLVLGEKRWEHLVYQVLLSLSTICFHVFQILAIICFFAAWVKGCDQTCGEKGNRCGLDWNPGA